MSKYVHNFLKSLGPFLLLWAVMLFLQVSPTAATICTTNPRECNNLELCSAAPGTCVEENHTVAAWSGPSCGEPTCGWNPDTDAPYCNQNCTGEGSCCYDTWNYCCTDGEAPGSPTPTGGGGGGSGPTPTRSPTPTSPISPSVTPPGGSYIISGQYRTSDTALCTLTGTEAVSINGATTALYNSSGAPILEPSLGPSGFSYALPVNQSFSVQLNIPAEAPYQCVTDCPNQTLVENNPKICQRVGLATANDSNFHFYVVSTASIYGSFYNTTNAYPYPGNCSGMTGSSLNLNASFIRLHEARDNLNPLTITPLNGASSYSFPDLARNLSYDLYLNLDPGSPYVCACPPAIDIEGKVCLHPSASAGMDYPFYLLNLSLNYGSWFQVVGGNIFAANSIHSVIPYLTCNSASGCIDALLVRQSQHQMSVGFPLLQSRERGRLSTTDTGTNPLSYIHEVDKVPNTNSYAVAALPRTYLYADILRRLNFIPPVITGGEANLDQWRAADWWPATLYEQQDRFLRVEGDLTLSEESHFALEPGESLTVFVNGRLRLEDSNPDDNNWRLTEVPEGAILIFIVRQDIEIAPSVGHNLDPLFPTGPELSVANSNLSGVFLADGSINIQSKTLNTSRYGALPDRKLIVAGSFIGWSNIELNRRFGDPEEAGAILNTNQATENFIFRPDFTANWPNALKNKVSRWTEKNPRRVNF